ncbi:MAG: ABC transporter permease [Mycoplasmoidaceae bacterium]
MKKINVNYKNEIFTQESLSRNKVLAQFLVTYFFKSKLSLIISFLLPVLFMVMYYSLSMGDDSGIQLFFGSLGVYISFSILPVTLISLPQIIVELKNSIILRRIKNSGFTKNNFLVLIFILYFFLALIFTLFVIGLFFIFLYTLDDPNDIRNDLVDIDIGGLIYTIFFFIISSLSAGILLSSIIKNVSYSLLSGIILIIVTTIFAGQFIPLTVIAGNEAFRYISLFSPLTYGASLLNTILMTPVMPEGGIGPSIEEIKAMQNIFDFSSEVTLPLVTSEDGGLFVIYTSWQKALNVIMPVIVPIGFILLSAKFFKWFGR